jgi:hypothetical protein
MALAKTLKAAIAPSTEAAYARTISDLADAKRVLAGIVARLVKVEANEQRRHGDTDSLKSERAKAKALIAQLERQGGELKAELIAARPQPPLSPLQQLFADASKHDPYANHKRGTREQIEKAKVEVANALRDYKLNDGSAQAMAKLNDARLKLAVLEGPPVTERTRRLFSAERLAAARKEQGLA